MKIFPILLHLRATFNVIPIRVLSRYKVGIESCTKCIPFDGSLSPFDPRSPIRFYRIIVTERKFLPRKEINGGKSVERERRFFGEIQPRCRISSVTKNFPREIVLILLIPLPSTCGLSHAGSSVIAFSIYRFTTNLVLTISNCDVL